MNTHISGDPPDVPRRIASWIAARAPRGCAVAGGLIRPSPPFDPAEEEAVARAVASRRDEFRTGRRLARQALAELGCPAVSLPPDRDRVPRWPEGFVGTISHSGEVCVAHAGRASDLIGIGIDIEKAERMAPEFAALVCRPEELGEPEDRAFLRFVAKEAFFKAYFPAARHFLEFHDVHVVLDAAGTAFEARLANPETPALHGARTFAGASGSLDGYAVAGVWIAR